MDPHEKVNMDAEHIMSGSWDFEFMVKETLTKLARMAKFHMTPLGSLIATIIRSFGPRFARPQFEYIKIYQKLNIL